jgi:hypothetical protein
MTQEQTSAELEVTDTSTENQESKTYSQKEFDDAVAKAKASIQHKVEKKYSELGNIEDLRKLKSEFEAKQQEEQIKRGEFETILQTIASKKDAEIAKRDNIIREYKVNTPILSAASKYKAINAEQVKALLAQNVNLDEDGEPVVLDQKGAIRYSENGTKLSVDDLVKEFLANNAHFVSPTPATTHTKSNGSIKGNLQVDVTKLNMNDPKDRELYKEYRKKSGIN